MRALDGITGEGNVHYDFPYAKLSGGSDLDTINNTVREIQQGKLDVVGEVREVVRVVDDRDSGEGFIQTGFKL